MMIHNFWIEILPQFANFEIVYYILDLVTVAWCFKILNVFVGGWRNW